MKLEAAVVREQGVDFVVVPVRRHVIANVAAANATVEKFQRLFRGLPVVVTGVDAFGRKKAVGRQDLARFVANIDHRRLPWKRYRIG